MAVSWSAWTDSGAHTNCGTWSPARSTVNWGSSFTQTASCQQSQTRARIYKVGTAEINRSNESRTINETGSQTNTGTKDFVSGTANGPWSGWSNVGSPYWFTEWSEVCENINFGTTFTRTRDYEQDQQRTRAVYDVWASGKANTINASSPEVGTTTDTLTQSDNEIGCKRNWVAYTSIYNPDWTNDGGPYGFSNWSPAPGSQTSGYTQSQSYSQNQYRMEQKRERDTISGDVRNVGSLIRHEQTLPKSQSRSVTVSWSGWSDTTRTGHSAWSPITGFQINSFYQTRTYTQNQSGSYTHKVGSTTIHNNPVTRALTEQSESRFVEVSWESWTNVGGLYSCTTWSPATSTVNLGVIFTQTNSCKQNQSRARRYKVNGVTIDTTIEAQAISVPGSKQATGTKVTVPVPSTPTGLFAFNECGTLHSIRWNAASGTVTHYQVWLNGSHLRSPSGTSTAVVTSSGTVYVKACNSTGCSGASNSISLRASGGICR